MRIPLESYKDVRNEQGFLVLPKEFSCRDGSFKQLARENDIALYQRDNGFEVIKIQSQEPFEITQGVFTEKKENFPSTSLWGTLGFTYLPCELERAKKKYMELSGEKASVQENDIEELKKEEKPKSQAVVNTNGEKKKGRGRPPVLTPCNKCSTLIYKSVWFRNKGLCDDCKAKG